MPFMISPSRNVSVAIRFVTRPSRRAFRWSTFILLKSVSKHRLYVVDQRIAHTRLISLSSLSFNACDRFRYPFKSEMQKLKSLVIATEVESLCISRDKDVSFFISSITDIAVSSISEQCTTCLAASCILSKLLLGIASSSGQVVSRFRTTSLYNQTALSKVSTMWTSKVGCREKGPCP